MADSPKVGSSVLVGMLAFIAATAWVAIEVVPGALDTNTRVFEPGPTQSRLIPASQSLAPNEAIVTYTPPTPAPAVEEPPPAAPVPQKVATRKVATHKAATRTMETNQVATYKVAAPVKRADAPDAPVEASAPTRTPIIVEARRPSQDERIQHLVMQRLASNPRLDGKIAVESRDAVVRLTGWTRTVGQARLAEQDARSVQSVRQVRNEIRPRIGGSV